MNTEGKHHLDDLIELGVQLVQEVDHLERRGLGAHGGEAHDVREVDGAGLEGLGLTMSSRLLLYFSSISTIWSMMLFFMPALIGLVLFLMVAKSGLVSGSSAQQSCISVTIYSGN